MQFEWVDIPIDIRDGLAVSLTSLKLGMNPMDVATIVWSLGELDCPLDAGCSSMLDPLLGACGPNLPHMKGPELTKLLVNSLVDY